MIAQRSMGIALRDAPAEYRIPEDRPTLAEAQRWCSALASTHYENFHVATWFLPARLRPHFESIYAFSRVADDLGDEVEAGPVALRLLREWRELLAECYRDPGRSQHPVFVALAETIRQTEVPEELFARLIRAFEQDQTKTVYGSWGELLAYSQDSANPVGRMVLWVAGYREERLGELSDKVCTALQLANFWQDVVEDGERGRRYLPAEAMEAFGVEDGQIVGRVFTPEFGAMMRMLVERTREMLWEGGEISRHVDAELGVTLDLFRKGGEAILQGIAQQGYDVLRGRPVVSRPRKAMLLAGALWARLRVLRRPAAAGTRPA